MVTIRITGLRGHGKTSTAIAITRLLREKGQRVRYVGWNREYERQVENIISNQEDPAFSEAARDFVVVDCDASE